MSTGATRVCSRRRAARVTARPALSEPLDPLAHDDPVAAVLAAHDQGVPLLLRTSGSSARPRDVRRSTASWFDSFPVVAGLTSLEAGARMWVPGPSAGTMNLFAAVLAKAVGADLVGSVDEATHTHLTPTSLRRALTEGRRLSGLRVTVAGDRLDRALHERAVSAGAVVTHYYGAAELSFVAWGSHGDDLRAFPGAQVVERDGLLWVRSPYLAMVPVDDEGFATVGDRGQVGPEGRVVVHGRGDTAVVTGGVTVVVEDVESVLRATTTGDVVVVGVRHPDLGEVLAAVLTDAGQVRVAHERARDELGDAQRPRLWYVVDELPRTGAGKTDRGAVRDQVASGRLRRVSPVGAG